MELSKQSLDTLKSRYWLAVRDIIAADPLNRPADKPEHVFDTDDLRLVISRSQDGVHISAAVFSGNVIARGLQAGAISRMDLVEIVVQQWQEISGSDRRPRLLRFSPRRFNPHLVVENPFP